jgi:hypothetical protein
MKTKIPYIFIISLTFVLRMKNVSDKLCRKNQNTQFVSNYFFFEKHVVYEMMCKGTVEPGRPQMTMWSMRIACRVPKATNTHIPVVLYSLPFHRNSGCANAHQCCYTYIVHLLTK